MSKTKTSVSLWSHQIIGILLAVVLIAGLGGWATMASISGAVIAPARVVVETNAKTIQHLEGGIVAEILAREGSRVKAGDVLIRLDQTETKANLAIINAQLTELLARQARLEAERDEASKIIFPEDITKNLNDTKVRTAYTGQKKLFQARRAAKQGEQDQLKTRISQYEEEIRGLKAQKTSKQQQLDLIKKELSVIKGLEEKGLVKMNRILALERERAKLVGEHGSLIAQIARMQGGIGETKLRIIQIDRNLISEISAQLRETQTKVAELLEKRLAAKIRLQRTEILAPQTGFVHQLEVHTVGGVVTPGAPVMSIVPEQDRLIFEAKINPPDIDQIHIGQQTTLRLQAFDQGKVPELNGEILLISADTIMDKATNTPYYMARVTVSKEDLKALGDGYALVPGMLAQAFIQTQPRTVMDYLLKPLSNQLAHAMRER